MTNVQQTKMELSEQLLKQCLDGDRRAQHRLYHLYAKDFLNKAYRIVWHKEDAKDVLQDAFLKIFRSLDRLQDASKFEGWAKRIVVNTAITLLRQKGKMPTFSLEIEELREPDNPKPDEDIQKWNIAVAKKALSQLAPGYRTVINLYLLEGYDHQEIAGILNISVSTSITQFNRGKKKLKSLVKKELSNG